MKTILVVLVSLLILFIVLPFIFVPSEIFISNGKTILVNRDGFKNCLHDIKKWKQWWPGQEPGKIPHSPGDSLFTYDGLTCKISKLVADGVEIRVQQGNLELLSNVLVIPKARDSVLAQWNTTLQTGNNPYSRLKNYFTAREIQKNMRSVFDSLCRFAEKIENVYDFPIVRTTFADTILAMSILITTDYPTTEEIYTTIDGIKKYIADNDASEKDHPMLNTKRLDNQQYQTMIAICINKKIPDSKEYTLVRMVNMQDKFLTTEVTGGPHMIQNAHAAIEKYMTDYKLSPPGRPFEILVTDRRKETDTSKWKTQVFHPSM